MGFVWHLIHPMLFVRFHKNNKEKIMKKLIVLSIMMLMLNVTPAFAKCEGGKVVIGSLNNHEYCVSTPAMTWWAAIAWCEFQGRKLATLNEACSPDGTTINGDQCLNLTHNPEGTKTGWTSTPSNNGSYYSVDMSTHKYNGVSRVHSFRALCY